MDRQDLTPKVEVIQYDLYFYIEKEGQCPTVHPTMMTEAVAKDCLGGKFIYGKFAGIGVQLTKIIQPIKETSKDIN